MNEILIIVNPSSGDKEGKDFSKRIKELYHKKGYKVDFYMTTGDDNFTTLIKRLLNRGGDTVILIGGDGTVSEFINQISPLNQRPKIILLPLGTTNNFARALDSEMKLEGLYNGLLEKSIVKNKVDVGQINNKYFISTVSLGTIPEVAWKTEDRLKEELGSLAYMIEGIKVIGEEANYFDVSIQIDQEKKQNEEDVFLIVIGLSNSVFGVPIFFKDAEIDDGLLHLYLLKKGTVSEISKSLTHRIVHNEEESNENDLSYVKSFKKASLISTSDLNSSVDGEKGPTFPIELDILPKHLTFYTIEKESILN